jgi:putative hydrolase
MGDDLRKDRAGSRPQRRGPVDDAEDTVDQRDDDGRERPEGEDGPEETPRGENLPDERTGQPGFRPSGSPGKQNPPPGSSSGNPLEDLLGPLFGGQFPGGQFPGGGIPGFPGGLPQGIPGFGEAGFDPAMMGQVLGQLQKFLAGGSDDPVNWDVAHDLARQAAAQNGDPTPNAVDRREIEDALRVADLWLDGQTDLEAAAATLEAWSRAEWVEKTMPVWRQLVEPVATNVAAAMGDAMAAQAPPEMAAMLGSAGAMLRQVGGGVFGMQVGQAIGQLAGEVVSTTDVGLPLAPSGRSALLPENIRSFAEGLEVPIDEVRRYLALREAAHQRLFAHVPWLRSHLLGSVESFARGISVDGNRIAEAAQQIDPTNPESLQEALSSGIFEPESTPAQQAALARLETALALVEGWVDHVTDEAARNVLPHAVGLRETMRRRRATGGPAEHAFAVLVGLELRPRRAREAAGLWELLLARGGRGARDAVWDHPDLLPTAEDLDDTAAFVDRRLGGGAAVGGTPAAEEDAMDAALRDLLDGGSESGGTTEGPTKD